VIEGTMVKQALAKKVTVYVDVGARYRGDPMSVAVLRYLASENVLRATVTKCEAGFAAYHEGRRRGMGVTHSVPLRIEFIDRAAKLDAVLPVLIDMISPGLLDVQDAVVLRRASSSNRRERPSRVRAKRGIDA
jgi:PII-like signaling protein